MIEQTLNALRWTQIVFLLNPDDRLAATLAHEINNPLGAAMNTVFLARSNPGIARTSIPSRPGSTEMCLSFAFPLNSCSAS
jgi:signal transduction histidine kinase